jgi:glycosyltransferase involved in cell wall biosynthesis
VIYSGQVEHFRPHLDAVHCVAHAGFVKEVRLWAGLFREVLVIAPDGFGRRMRGDEIPYDADNVTVQLVDGRPFHTRRGWRRLTGPLHIPRLLWQSRRWLREDDVVMSRIPDGLGWGALFLAWAERRPMIGKCASQWDNFPGEPLTYRIQKWFYRSPWWCRGPVQIYGAAHADRPHLRPFFTSSVTRAVYDQIGPRLKTAHRREPSTAANILFVGRFYALKGPEVLVKGFSRVASEFPGVTLTLAGEGPLKPALQHLAARCGLQDRLRFTGWVGEERLSELYLDADVLVHPALAEGFGKVLIEAMAHGLPVLGTGVVCRARSSATTIRVISGRAMPTIWPAACGD